MTEVNPRTIHPAGWLLEFLSRQNSGLTGHREALDYPFNTCLWHGDISMARHDTPGWWPYEQTAYFLDGALRLGYLLNDKALIDLGTSNVDFVLAHADSRGHLGPLTSGVKSEWPMVVFFRAIEAEYLATGDARIPAAMERHFRGMAPESLAAGHRHICNLEGLLKTYEWTGDRDLLEKAKDAYALFGKESRDSPAEQDGPTMEDMTGPDPVAGHGVTYMEMVKLPAILYGYTGDAHYLAAAKSGLRKLETEDMQVDGVPSSNESLAGDDPLMSHETCDISDFTWSTGYLMMATGEAHYGDLIEKACFNAGPGAVSKDFKSLQYFSSVNQFIATSYSNHNRYFHGTNWMQYAPVHETECCAGNVNRFMPNYAARMWMKSDDGGVVACLYGPSVYSASDESQGD